MAIQNKSLIGAEHDWYATRSGLGNTATLNDHKAAYYGSKGFGSNASIFRPLSQVENEWLSKMSGIDSDYMFDLWAGACTANSVTPGKTVDDCKMRFFTSVASGTNP